MQRIHIQYKQKHQVNKNLKETWVVKEAEFWVSSHLHSVEHFRKHKAVNSCHVQNLSSREYIVNFIENWNDSGWPALEICYFLKSFYHSIKDRSPRQKRLKSMKLLSNMMFAHEGSHSHSRLHCGLQEALSFQVATEIKKTDKLFT